MIADADYTPPHSAIFICFSFDDISALEIDIFTLSLADERH